MTTLPRLLAGLCALTLCAARAGAQATSNSQQVVLSERLSLSIPIDDPAGLAVVAVNSFLVWDQASLVAVSPGSVTEFNTGPAVHIGAAVKHGGRVYLFDTVLREIVVLSEADGVGAQTIPVEIPHEGSINAAAFTECGLVVLLDDAAGGGGVAVLDLSGRALASKPVALGGHSHLVSGLTEGFALTPQDPNRSIDIYSCDLREPRSIALASHDRPEDGKWVTNRLLPLGSGYLITLSDFWSDNRVLVVLDSTGSVMRASVIDAPLAFVAVTPDGGHAVAVRYTGENEIVVYSFRSSGQ